MVEHLLTSYARHNTAVADTSSLLIAGTSLLNHIEHCQFVIPSIVVHELEGKRHSASVGSFAREWLRLLENLRTQHQQQLASGIELKNGVVLQVRPNDSNQNVLPDHLQDGSHDSTVLAVATRLAHSTTVVLITNDTPMRLHATLDVGLKAVDFNAAMLEQRVFHGQEDVVVDDDEYVHSRLYEASTHDVYEPDSEVYAAISRHRTGTSARALLNVTLPDNSHLGSFLYTPDAVYRINSKTSCARIQTRTKEQNAALQYLQSDPATNPVVSLGGSAGTGKTLLSLAAGVDGVQNGQYDHIVVFRGLHEMGAQQEVGSLPGDLSEKMKPWSGAIEDAFHVIEKAHGQYTNVDRSMIEVSPIAYLRGRSLSHSYIILEEAQNFSKKEILNVMSRIGEGSKFVMTFDPAQVDNRYLSSGEDSEMWSVVDRLRAEDMFAHITLWRTERSRLADLAARVLDE